jgi:hypothetical protein
MKIEKATTAKATLTSASCSGRLAGAPSAKASARAQAAPEQDVLRQPIDRHAARLNNGVMG